MRSDTTLITPAQYLSLAVLILAFLFALIWQAQHTGITVDEPAHLLSACLYWQGNDVLFPRDMPPLIKIASGWVPRLHGIPIPYDSQAWKDGLEWVAAQEMMGRLPLPDIQPLFFFARLPMLIFPLLSCLLIFRWGSEILGNWGAIAAVALFVLEPTVLGHGALIKNDHAATMAFLCWSYCVWRYWHVPSWRNAILLSAAALLAIMAKLSMIITAPLTLAVLVWIKAPERWKRVLLFAAILYGGMCLTSWYDLTRISRRTLFLMSVDSHAPAWFWHAAKIFYVLPAPNAYFQGIASLADSSAAGNPVFFLGERIGDGSLAYFLVAFALKLPVALQLLALAGFTLLCRTRKILFLAIPPAIYILCGSVVALQLGVRLMMPVFPFLAIFGAAALLALWRKAPIATVAALLVFAAEGLPYFPHGISFFNRLAGGPEGGMQYLANSNIDWGQDLPALRRWMDVHHVNRFHLSYFGNDRVERLFDEREFENLVAPWDPSFVKSERLEPEPGIYAISVNLLLGHFFEPRFRNYFAAFRDRKPAGRAGYSILIYRIE